MLESKPLKIKSLQLMPIANEYNEPSLHNHKYGLNYANMYTFIDALDEHYFDSDVPMEDVIEETLLMNDVTDIIKINKEKIGDAKIANGWNNERFVFLLITEIKTDSGTLESYIQGYTDHKDQIDDDTIDPRMKFHVNSVIDIFRAIDPVTKEEIILKGDNYNVIRKPENGNIVYGFKEDLIIIRPYDLLVNKAYEDMYEDDIIHNKSVLHNNVVSNRANNTPLKFIAKIIDSYTKAAYTATPYMTPTDTIKAASSFALENNTMHTPFIQRLYCVTGEPDNFDFDLGLLSKINPEIKECTTILNMASDREITPDDTNSLEYNIAIEMTHSISAILTDNFLSTIEFNINNKTGVPLISIQSVNSFIPGTDMNSNLENVISQIMLKVMPKISENNKFLLDINVSCNILTDSVISVTIGDGVKSEFVFPTFADGLYSPVISTESALNEMDPVIDVLVNSLTIY